MLALGRGLRLSTRARTLTTRTGWLSRDTVAALIRPTDARPDRAGHTRLGQRRPFPPAWRGLATATPPPPPRPSDDRDADEGGGGGGDGGSEIGGELGVEGATPRPSSVDRGADDADDDDAESAGAESAGGEKDRASVGWRDLREDHPELVRQLAILTASQLVLNLGFTMIVPAMPLFAAEMGGHLGSTGIGMVIAAPRYERDRERGWQGCWLGCICLAVGASMW